MIYVYVIENETDVCGAWSTPEKAVKAYLDVDENGMVEWGNGRISIKEAVQKMLAADSDYPVISKVPINPPNSMPRWAGGICWYRDS